MELLRTGYLEREANSLVDYVAPGLMDYEGEMIIPCELGYTEFNDEITLTHVFTKKCSVKNSKGDDILVESETLNAYPEDEDPYPDYEYRFKYILVWVSNNKDFVEEWLDFETPDYDEAVERLEEWKYKLKNEHSHLEFREMANAYDYNPIDISKALTIKRSENFNMRAICERADVNYSTWRRFKSGLQNMSDKKIAALNKAMDEA